MQRERLAEPHDERLVHACLGVRWASIPSTEVGIDGLEVRRTNTAQPKLERLTRNWRILLKSYSASGEQHTHLIQSQPNESPDAWCHQVRHLRQFGCPCEAWLRVLQSSVAVQVRIRRPYHF